jgi:EAL domain-containing protein (putative c-di-GMP-specific phosphodiesterase class I)
MGRHAHERLELETDLRRAIDRRELEVRYQPIVHLESGRVSALEALVWWNHPAQGTLPPERFIPLAEETGLIVPIGRWALREACETARQLNARTVCGAGLKVNVNLSPRQFKDPGLVNDLSASLAQSGLEPFLLGLEITEDATIQDTESAIATLRALKALGIQLAIDDFGTGYSSLAYLTRFPIDVLKIDRVFVDGLARDSGSRAIVQAVTMFAHTMGLSVTAEGIATGEQLTHVRALGCDNGQGLHLLKAMTAGELEALLAARPTLVLA